MKTPRIFNAALLAAALGGCAAVPHVPTAFTPIAVAQAVPRVLAATAGVSIGTGYARTLKAGSRWQRTGTVPQGDVYKPYGDVFTLEGAHIHEAWLVLQGDQLVGFYLPVERGYTPLTPPVLLHFQKQG
jgi:hypothetical protein